MAHSILENEYEENQLDDEIVEITAKQITSKKGAAVRSLNSHQRSIKAAYSQRNGQHVLAHS